MAEPFDELATPDSSGDDVINDLMAKRKLQQEALLKIMTSMDKADEPQEEPRKEDSVVGAFWKKKVRSVFGPDRNQKK